MYIQYLFQSIENTSPIREPLFHEHPAGSPLALLIVLHHFRNVRMSFAYHIAYCSRLLVTFSGSFASNSSRALMRRIKPTLSKICDHLSHFPRRLLSSFWQGQLADSWSWWCKLRKKRKNKTPIKNRNVLSVITMQHIPHSLTLTTHPPIPSSLTTPPK